MTPLLSFSLFSGSAALVAALTPRRLTTLLEELVLTAFLAYSATTLLSQLFVPQLRTQEWYVAHECLFALFLTLYAVAGSSFKWTTPAGLGAFFLIGIELNRFPLTDHCAYRGLIVLDLALMVVLYTQRAPHRSKVHAVVSLLLGLVAFVNAVHHAAWEWDVDLARALGRAASVLFTISMLLIAAAGRQDLNSHATPTRRS